MNDQTQSTSSGLWAKFVLYIGLIGLLALPVGALGARFGAWPFTTGFQVLFGAVLLSAAALVLGIAGYIRAAVRRRQADKMPVVVGVVASAVALGWMGLQYMAATAHAETPIHNVSTDMDDPPVFHVVPLVRAPCTNPYDYDEEDAEAQMKVYPHLAGVRSSRGVTTSVERAAALARDKGWKIVNENAALGIVEATATSFWFGFKDDIVIRVRADGRGSQVDMRSVSCVGQGDLGANAARIEAFLEEFSQM